MTSVRVSPTLARCEHSSTRPMNASPASRPPSQPKENTAPGPFGRYLLRERVVRVVREAAVADPRHARILLQPLRDLLRVGHVRVHPQRQRLHALQDQERVERREHAAEVAQPFDAQLGGEAVLAEVVPEAQVAVGGDGLGHHGEVAVVPREPAGVDDRAGDRRAVTAEVLGGAVDDDVGAVVERAAQVRARERGVHDQREPGLVGDVGERFEVRDRARRVGDDLGVEQLRAAGDDRGRERLGIVGGDERRLDVQAPQRDVQQRERAAVERAGRDHVVARVAQLREQQRLRRLAAARRHRADPALEARDPLLERRDRRIAEPRVDVPVLLQGEQVGRVRGVLEHERRRLVDGDGARPGGRVRPCAGVDRAGAHAPIPVCGVAHAMDGTAAASAASFGPGQTRQQSALARFLAISHTTFSGASWSQSLKPLSGA